MIKLVAFVLGCVAGYALNENIEVMTGKNDPIIKQPEPLENVPEKVKLEKKQI